MGDWAILSQGAEGASVSRCPGGHIHLAWGPVNLKLDDTEFLVLVRMLAQAARSVRGAYGVPGIIFEPERRQEWFSEN